MEINLKVYPISAKSNALWRHYSELVKRKNNTEYLLNKQDEELAEYDEKINSALQSLSKWLLTNPDNQNLSCACRLQSCIIELKLITQSDGLNHYTKSYSNSVQSVRGTIVTDVTSPSKNPFPKWFNEIILETISETTRTFRRLKNKTINFS